MEKKEKINLDKYQIIILSLICIIVGLLIGVVIMHFTSNKNNSTKDTSGVIVPDDHNITTYLYDHEILKGKDLEVACDNILNKLDTLEHSSAYLQLQVGEQDYDTYVYNTKGECFAQSSTGDYTTVKTKDGINIKLDSLNEEISTEQDLDLVSLLKNIVSLSKDNTENYVFYNMIMSEESDITEYRIEVKGADAFKQPYSGEYEEVGKALLEQLNVTMGADWVPHFVYCFVLTDDNIAVCCYLIDEGKEYVNWYSNGYVPLNDWELPSGWYDKSLEEMTFDEVNNLVNETVLTLDKVIEEYATENGLVYDEEISESEETDTEESTEITEEIESEASEEISETEEE